MIRINALAVGIAISTGSSVWAQHDWTVQSQSPGTTDYVGVSEDFLMTGQPWDSDGNSACPPDGDDDVRCEWLTDHGGAEAEHQMNGVIGAVLDGSANQSVVFLSDVWTDPINSGSTWWVKYDVHFVGLNPAQLNQLRVTSRYQHNGSTFLTLNLTGIPGTIRVRHQVAPTHVWTETPETGNNWRIQLSLIRTQPGDPAMIWVDNLLITEGANTLFTDDFPLQDGDLNGDGLVGPADLAIVLGNWGPCRGCPADLNGDGVVGPADLAIVLGNWG